MASLLKQPIATNASRCRRLELSDPPLHFYEQGGARNQLLASKKELKVERDFFLSFFVSKSEMKGVEREEGVNKKKKTLNKEHFNRTKVEQRACTTCDNTFFDINGLKDNRADCIIDLRLFPFFFSLRRVHAGSRGCETGSLEKWRFYPFHCCPQYSGEGETPLSLL